MTHVWILASALAYPTGGGHLWVYLNWALAIRSAGCRVTWFELVRAGHSPDERSRQADALSRNLRPFGFDRDLVITDFEEPGIEWLDRAAEADALISLRYGAPAAVVDRFPRRALIDIDPGLLQFWMAQGHVNIATHDHYFTIGENVARSMANVPGTGLTWTFTPPPVDLESWPVTPPPADGAFTTVTHWDDDDEWVTDSAGFYRNTKREGFLPYLDVPSLTCAPLELALRLGNDHGELQLLEGHGWRVRDSAEVAATPAGYQRYIQGSRGEFSAAKPSSSRLNATWISDRTICYLATGRPAVIQYTGPSSLLPDGLGTIRFRTLQEAAVGLDLVLAEYERHATAARALAEAHFDGRRVATRVLERLLS